MQFFQGIFSEDIANLTFCLSVYEFIMVLILDGRLYTVHTCNENMSLMKMIF